MDYSRRHQPFFSFPVTNFILQLGRARQCVHRGKGLIGTDSPAALDSDLEQRSIRDAQGWSIGCARSRISFQNCVIAANQAKCLAGASDCHSRAFSRAEGLDTGRCELLM
eukprot:269292-Pelagomonas_calceolata.AAC.9